MALPKLTARPAIRATELTPDAARRLVISYGRVTQSIVKTLIFTVFAPGTVGVYIPYRLRGPGPHAISALGAFGLAPVAVGAAISMVCVGFCYVRQGHAVSIGCA